MGRTMTVVVVGLVMAAALGWQYRVPLLEAMDLRGVPLSAARPAEQPDILYTWVDDKGVTHYEQQSGKGQRVAYDGSGITPLDKPDPGQVERLRKAAGEETPAGSGNPLVDLRHELQEGSRQMQAAKAAQTDF